MQAANPFAPKKCPICRTEARPGREACEKCGTRLNVFEGGDSTENAPLRRYAWLAILFASFGLIGIAGLHRFYLGHTRSAWFMLLTLGGFGVWTLWDLHKLWDNGLYDSRGLALRELGGV